MSLAEHGNYVTSQDPNIRLSLNVQFLYAVAVGEDLKDVLMRLYEAGAEDVPAADIPWEPTMTPAIVVGLNMGYMRYREREGIKHFYLTPAGYGKIGIQPFSTRQYIIQTIRNWFGLSGRI